MKKAIALMLCAMMLFALCACSGSGSSSAPAATAAPAAAAAPAAEEAPADAAAEIEAISFSLGDVSGTGTFLEQNAEFFAQKVDELSGGKMHVDVFSDGLLGTEDALMTNIQTGALEMANFSSTFTNLVKSAGIFDFPYLVSDRDQLDLLEEAGVIDFIRAEAESINIKIVGMNENGFRQITTNTPVVEPEDLKGIVIRTPSNSLRVKTFEAFGANPVSISFSELYQSLSQHICDAQENPLATIVSSQFYDYQTHLCISNHVYTPGWICMNLGLYNSLSDAQRAVIDEAGRLTSLHVREAGAQADEDNLKACQEHGMTVTYADVDAFRAIVVPLWDEFADSVGGADFVNMAKTALGA